MLTATQYNTIKILLYCIQFVAIAVIMMFGAWIVKWPRKVIDLHVAFYRLLNWKVEPISMDREIMNTRFMGTVVVVCGIAAIIYVIVR